ncbi:hypothetical protein MC378_09365 [Polaribacter sp. MSW13]|uniref:Uncharacterized protein n=1 Tax=Polaribacter marinus TaxID=2916838 RepID=A0A9X1VPE3_9FLAO|nr:hypothetical protein [Polaribacter marinus]MCI2229373.1 hypothetical protein [Polaribacter marinus]
MKKLHLFFTLAIIAFSIQGQELAMNTPSNYSNNITSEATSSAIVPLLTKTTYTYKYHGNDVLVIFTDNEHIEYFNNKKHFIKSSLVWTSNDECYMTIEDSNLPNFPFSNGTKLNMKITKIKRGYIFYESTLGGRSWTGKMKKLN